MKNKKEKLVVILLVVGLIVMAGVISFAAFKFTQTGSVLNQITTGSITMSYTESSNVISMTGALPTTDATGKVRLNEGEYFDFTVGSSITGTANINYEIAAQELDGNTIDGSYIKYYLTKVNEDNSEEEVMAPTTYTEETTENEYTGRPANMMSLYEGSMNASTTVKYRLRLYVDESYNPQGDGGNLIYKVRVNVYGMTGDKISKKFAPGLYDVDGNMEMTWDELLNATVTYTDYIYGDTPEETEEVIKEVKAIYVNDGILSTSLNPNSPNSPSSSLLSSGKILIIDDSIKSIAQGCFEMAFDGLTVFIPNSVTSIGNYAFSTSDDIKVVVHNSVLLGQDVFTYSTGTLYYSGEQSIESFRGTIKSYDEGIELLEGLINTNKAK